MKRKALTNSYLSSLCLEMSLLLQSGIAIGHGVSMIHDDETDINSKLVLQSLLKTLEKNEPLSEAMKESSYFPVYTVTMVEIGEKTGRLAETLKALSEHYERQERLSDSIKNATLYPAILLGMMVVVVLILIVQVLPMFHAVFGRMGAQMPTFAIRLLQFGTWFRGAAVAVALISTGIFVLAFALWAIPSLRGGIVKSWKNKFGNVGLFGRIASFQFMSSMSLAIASGLDIKESVSMSASLNNDSAILNKQYEKCLSMLESGDKLADALKDSGILSPRDSRMLSLGEQSGMADTAMMEIARRNGNIVQDDIARIISRIEPTLVIATSAIVGIVLLSVMLPLMGIMTSIG